MQQAVALAARQSPRHVAIIMDGNGRWAQSRGLERLAGHRKGKDSVKAIVELCKDIGIKYLSLYAFSEENWSRPQREIDFLMKLLQRFLLSERKTLMRNRVRLLFLPRLREEIGPGLDRRLLRLGRLARILWRRADRAG